MQSVRLDELVVHLARDAVFGHSVTDDAAPRTKRVVQTERRDRPFKTGMWLKVDDIATDYTHRRRI